MHRLTQWMPRLCILFKKTKKPSSAVGYSSHIGMCPHLLRDLPCYYSCYVDLSAIQACCNSALWTCMEGSTWSHSLSRWIIHHFRQGLKNRYSCSGVSGTCEQVLWKFWVLNHAGNLHMSRTLTFFQFSAETLKIMMMGEELGAPSVCVHSSWL